MLVKSPLDLSVNAKRPVCKGSNHSGIMGDEVKGQGLEANTVCIVFLCAGMTVFFCQGRVSCTDHQACDGRCSRGILISNGRKQMRGKRMGETKKQSMGRFFGLFSRAISGHVLKRAINGCWCNKQSRSVLVVPDMPF